MPDTNNDQWGVRIGGATGTQTSDNLHERFLQMLQANPPAIPQLWTLELTTDVIDQVVSRTAGGTRHSIDKYEHTKWLYNSNIEQIFSNGYAHIDDTFLVIAQAGSVPGDQIKVQRSPILNAGYLGGITGGGRGEPDNVRISFFETVQSFVDFVIRPWMLMAGHKSLKDRRLRHNITIVEWYRDPKTQTIIRPKQRTTLVGAVPVSIQVEELNYTSQEVIYRQVDFRYDSYYISEFPQWNQKTYMQNDSRGPIVDQFTTQRPLTTAATRPSTTTDPSSLATADNINAIPIESTSNTSPIQQPASQQNQATGSPTAFIQSRDTSFRNVGGAIGGSRGGAAGGAGISVGRRSSDLVVTNDGSGASILQNDRVRSGGLSLGGAGPIPNIRQSSPVFRLGIGGLDQQTTTQTTVRQL